MTSSIYRKLFWVAVFFFISTCAFGPMALAQGGNSSQGNSSQEVTNAVVSSPSVEAKGVEISGQPNASAPEALDLSAAGAPKSENITLDFKEANIRDVLKIISYKSGVNIVSSPEVTGTVNVRITDVPWERALDVILKTYGYAYDKQGSIIMVAPLDKLTAQRKMEQDLAQVQPTLTEVVTLKYIDAIDAKKAIEPQLSPRGKVTVLEITGQAGWGFGGSFSEKRSRTAQTSSRSKTLIVSDIPPVLDKIKKVLEDIDVQPKQILIETKLVEFDLNKLKDYGFDYATGGAGSASTTTVTTDSLTNSLRAGGHVLGGLGITPAAFLPQASGISAANTGMNFVFDKLSGSRFEVILHALEEDVSANVLSAPSILTLDNQEATILVGEQFPIISTTKSSDTSTTVDVSLQEYKDIGIQLNVVPQISGKDKDYINMILHPAVTTEGALIANEYPRITTREAQTQLLIKSGETVMIGGLMKEIKSDSVEGVPFLRKIPLIGKFFEHKTINTQKINLVIFITAHIVDDKNLAAEQLSSLAQNLSLHQSPRK
jgi:type IV pilus assembly protein PilQ